ncbi:hypothetical protein Tdes44962_MAKER03739 [Teratosphaeria destructans]|uniref:Uncharacterized protein n=1 Tax=Teratosphaeria destructans TaxID=418781 RepID=A0A9W7W0R9_9PEZI|nr:hypothetical protein Tdes44962_MAKER03739 [Teratosphaeria destructans]
MTPSVLVPLGDLREFPIQLRRFDMILTNTLVSMRSEAILIQRVDMNRVANPVPAPQARLQFPRGGREDRLNILVHFGPARRWELAGGRTGSQRGEGFGAGHDGDFGLAFRDPAGGLVEQVGGLVASVVAVEGPEGFDMELLTYEAGEIWIWPCPSFDHVDAVDLGRQPCLGCIR